MYDKIENLIQPLFRNILNYEMNAILAVFLIAVLYSVFCINLKRKEKEKLAMFDSTYKQLKYSEEKYRTLINNLNVGIAVISSEGKYLVHNQKYQELLNINNNYALELSKEELNKRYIMADGENCDLPYTQVMRTKQAIYDFTVGVRQVGSVQIVWVKSDAIPEFDPIGNITRVIITLVDITDRKKAEIALIERDNRWKAFLQAIPDLFFILDGNGTYIDVYAQKQELLIRKPAELIGKNLMEVLSDNLAGMFIQAISKCLDTLTIQTIEYNLEIDQKEFYFEARIVSCGADRVLSVVRDVTAKKESEDKLYHLSVQDSLTGLYNRNYFEERLDGYQAESTIGLGILVCDIDGLMMINDILGHACGDEYLKLAAKTIKQCSRHQDIVARIGGDEFAVFMNRITVEELNCIKTDIEKRIQKLNKTKRDIPISISMGYAVGDGTIKDVREVLKLADKWMYREKLHHLQSGKSKSIDSLSKMLEARDFITEGHGDRMKELCCQLAIKIGMSENEINDLRLFSHFHDIGKIGIPDRILFKPGKLTEDEMNEMKRHTEIGYRIAETSQELMHISGWILKHHEWWNGRGYPFQLAGHEIPIQCRILSIIDAFDAMTNDRPYRMAMTREAALKEIMNNKGNQFDPDLVDHFCGLWKE